MELTQEILHELIDLDHETGFVFHKAIDVKWFSDNSYFTAQGMCDRRNVRWAGVQAKNPNKLGYYRISLLGKRYLLHRVIWLYLYGEWPDVIDHENGIPNDNRPCNLRNVSRSLNQKNHKIHKNNTSGCMGVSFMKELGKWRVRIFVEGKVKHIGVYDSYEEAVLVRKSLEKENDYHENHARTA